MMNSFKKESSGFYKINESVKHCNSPEHFPGSMIHVLPGTVYNYKCPVCGHVTQILPETISLDDGRSLLNE